MSDTYTISHQIETRIPADQLETLAQLVARYVQPEARGLTKADACEMIGIKSPATLDKLERAGLLHPFRYDGIVRYDSRDIARLLASGDHTAICAAEAA